MPQQLEQPLFALKKGEPTMVETPDGFIVAVPAEIVEADPKADPAGYDQMRQAVGRSVGDDLASVFADALRDTRRTAHQSTRSGQRHRPTTMNVTVPPGFASFRSAYDAGRGTLVWRRGVADLETPVAAFLKLAHGRPNSFLLESVEGGAARGRYSIIGMEPDLVWRCRDGQAEVNRYALSAPHAFVAGRAAGAGQPARHDRRDPARRAAQPAADGGRAGRLSRLRHGAADGAPAGEEPRRDRRAGRR